MRPVDRMLCRIDHVSVDRAAPKEVFLLDGIVNVSVMAALDLFVTAKTSVEQFCMLKICSDFRTTAIHGRNRFQCYVIQALFSQRAYFCCLISL